MKDWITEHKIYVIAIVLLVMGAVYYVYFYEPPPAGITSLTPKEESITANIKKTEPEKKDQPETIMVDVKGQIKHPGVYQSRTQERVIDVVTRAGGLTATADEAQVNFAEHVYDEMVIYIPAKGEEELPSVTSEGGSAAAENSAGVQGKIDLNKADVAELQNLPGIGPAKAAAIMEYREKNGKFKSTEDLKNISGIGDKTFEKLKDLIVVH
jgi:competence protein ComEA